MFVLHVPVCHCRVVEVAVLAPRVCCLTLIPVRDLSSSDRMGTIPHHLSLLFVVLLVLPSVCNCPSHLSGVVVLVGTHKAHVCATDDPSVCVQNILDISTILSCP